MIKLRGRKRTDMMPVALEADKLRRTTASTVIPVADPIPVPALSSIPVEEPAAVEPSLEEINPTVVAPSVPAVVLPAQSRVTDALAQWDAEMPRARRGLSDADNSDEPPERRLRITEVKDESDDEQILDDDENYPGDTDEVISDEEIYVAKMKELERMQHFGLYEVVPKDAAQGKHFITTKWVLVRKAGNSVRARYVCREFKHGKKRDDLFAPSTTSITMRVIDVLASKRRLCTLTGDISNAFFHAPEDEEVYYQPPDEWYEQNPEHADMLWRGLKQLYGRRKATKNFAKFMANMLKTECGMEQCDAAPHLFRNVLRGIMLELHVDDYHCCGAREQLEALQADIERCVMVKEFVIHSPERDEVYEHLQRRRHLKHEGTWLSANETRIDEVKKIWNMEFCKAAQTPAVRHTKESNGDLQALDPEDAEKYRRSVGILLYIAHDRPDAQWSIGELAKYIQKPTAGGLQRLKRVIRYLSGTADYGIWISSKGNLEEVTAWVDSDWAGDKETRKSTSAVIITVGDSMVYSSSRRQHARALSSGEAEDYAATVGAADLLHVCEVMRFFGIEAKGQIFTDSSACIGMASRRGVGRVRHLETRALWLQEIVEGQRLTIVKIPGADNISDIGTKALECERHNFLMKQMGMQKMNGETKVNMIGDLRHSGGAGGTLSQHSAVLSALALFLQALGAKAQEAVNDSEHNQGSDYLWVLIWMVFIVDCCCGVLKVVRWLYYNCTE